MFTDFSKLPLDFYKITTDYFSKIPKSESEIKELFSKLQAVLQEEYKSSQDMWKTYQKVLTGDASPNEVSEANKKAQELLKSTGFAFLVSIPGTLFALPLIVETAKNYGVDLVPESVSKEFAI